MDNGDPGLIGRQAAGRLAREELSKAVYHPHMSFFQWLAGKTESLLSRLLNGTGGIPGGWWALVAIAALVVVAVTVILRRIGPVARSRRARTGGLSGSTLRTAREHREGAERAAAAGDYSAAILEYLRAIAAGLEERGVVGPDPGRTADEFAAQSGRLLPAHAAGLASAARLFDDVRYGGQHGTRTGCERLGDLEAAIAATAPRPAVPAVPA
jgi:Domain of unknown function (DUF4129)